MDFLTCSSDLHDERYRICSQYWFLINLEHIIYYGTAIQLINVLQICRHSQKILHTFKELEFWLLLQVIIRSKDRQGFLLQPLKWKKGKCLQKGLSSSALPIQRDKWKSLPDHTAIYYLPQTCSPTTISLWRNVLNTFKQESCLKRGPTITLCLVKSPNLAYLNEEDTLTYQHSAVALWCQSFPDPSFPS